MVTDLVIDQEGRRLCILEKEINAEKKKLLVLDHLSPRVGAVSACRGRAEDIMDWKMSHESSHWQNPTSFQYGFKEHSGERFLSETSLKSVCGERAAQQAQLCLGTGAQAGQGRDERHGSSCGCSQGQFHCCHQFQHQFPQNFMLLLARQGLCS